MQHLRTVRSWKFRVLQSNLGLLHEERLQKAYSPTLSEFRSSYSAISCKARTNIQASIQSKNQCHFPWQWSWCLERIFQVVYTFLESESSFMTLTTSSALIRAIHSLIPETPLGLAPPFPYTYCFTSHIHSQDTQLTRALVLFPSILFPYEELPLSLTEVNTCLHRTE